MAGGRNLFAVFAAVMLLCLLFSARAQCAVNPFLSGKGAKKAERVEDAGQAAATEQADDGSIFGTVMNSLARAQMEIRQRMTGMAREIKTDPWGGAFWLLMLLSFLYGALHALGPGHGKLLTASYFLNRPGGFRAALVFGNLTMFFHVLSATLLVVAGYCLLGSGAGSAMDTMGVRLELVSYTLLCVLGMGMAVFAMRDMRHGHSHGSGHGHGTPDCGVSWKGLVSMAFAAGMIPCPGAALVLTFTFVLGIAWAGLLSMLCITLGMGLTISATACLVVGTRGLLLRVAEEHGRTWNMIHGILALGGALCIAGLGAVMLMGAYARM